jgi:hypothetical protein
MARDGTSRRRRLPPEGTALKHEVLAGLGDLVHQVLAILVEARDNANPRRWPHAVIPREEMSDLHRVLELLFGQHRPAEGSLGDMVTRTLLPDGERWFELLYIDRQQAYHLTVQPIKWD